MEAITSELVKQDKEYFENKLAEAKDMVLRLEGALGYCEQLNQFLDQEAKKAAEEAEKEAKKKARKKPKKE